MKEGYNNIVATNVNYRFPCLVISFLVYSLSSYTLWFCVADFSYFFYQNITAASNFHLVHFMLRIDLAQLCNDIWKRWTTWWFIMVGMSTVVKKETSTKYFITSKNRNVISINLWWGGIELIKIMILGFSVKIV